MAQDLSDFRPPKSKGVLKEAEKKQPMGRPVKPESERKIKKVSLNFTEAEKVSLTDLAEERGMPVTVLIRTLLKEHGYI